MASLLPLLLLAAGSSAAARGADAACSTILPPQQVAEAVRPLLPQDLVRIRDIGPGDPYSETEPLFTLSPDGGRVAFQLRQADPATNGYCLAMVVIGAAPGARPTIVDEGGELLLLTIDNSGTADFPTGIPAIITPRWSPDGRWIAFLKHDGGATQVWRAAADGSGSAPLTHSLVDVRDFRISADGTALIYTTRPGVEEAKELIDKEGLSGFHYDDRFAPVDGNHPFPAPPIARLTEILDLRTGDVRAATVAESADLASGPDLTGAEPPPANHHGDPAVWISAARLAGGARPNGLHLRMADGSTITCRLPQCEGASRPWVLADGRRVRFMRREGWGDSTTAIYEWTPATHSAVRLYATDDLLADCVPSAGTMLCLRDASLQPRRLERLDPATGARQLLFDPNPEWSRLTLGKAERLHWRNAFGLECFGDLVLPVGYRRGRKYPLIVVQYQTRGFLRGGTGDEYPIQAFANRGYAVLSVQRPMPIAIARGARTFHEGDTLNMKGFADRKSTFSSVDAGVRLLIRRGIADPRQIGITGLSNGATTVAWALLHSSLFSAAAMSSCCFDTTLAMRVGPLSAREYREVGYPGMLERNSRFWRDISLSANARRIRTPILLQLADYEYMNALETYSSLREAGAPIDMFVFPGEHHNKSQPDHRLAVYRRSLDWFDYWLRGIRSSDADRQKELAAWDLLRRSLR